MPITFSCPGGKSYTVADKLAGERTHCPACRAALTVPEPVFELSAADAIGEVDGGDVVEDCEVVESEVAVVEEASGPANAPR